MNDKDRDITAYEFMTDQYKENERLKAELAEVKRFLQELNYGGELKGVWKMRIERFIK